MEQFVLHDSLFDVDGEVGAYDSVRVREMRTYMDRVCPVDDHMDLGCLQR